MFNPNRWNIWYVNITNNTNILFHFWHLKCRWNGCFCVLKYKSNVPVIYNFYYQQLQSCKFTCGKILLLLYENKQTNVKLNLFNSKLKHTQNNFRISISFCIQFQNCTNTISIDAVCVCCKKQHMNELSLLTHSYS